MDLTPEEQKFWRRVDRSGDCWLWLGPRDRLGYGRFAPSHGRVILTHRYAYTTTRGPIPAGLELDHLCRNTSCVRPAHLEAVTHAENCRRGHGGRPRGTHCINGHLFDYRDRNGRARCRLCVRDAQRRHRERTAA